MPATAPGHESISVRWRGESAVGVALAVSITVVVVTVAISVSVADTVAVTVAVAPALVHDAIWRLNMRCPSAGEARCDGICSGLRGHDMRASVQITGRQRVQSRAYKASK